MVRHCNLTTSLMAAQTLQLTEHMSAAEDRSWPRTAEARYARDPCRAEWVRQLHRMLAHCRQQMLHGLFWYGNQSICCAWGVSTCATVAEVSCCAATCSDGCRTQSKHAGGAANQPVGRSTSVSSAWWRRYDVVVRMARQHLCTVDAARRCCTHGFAGIAWVEPHAATSALAAVGSTDD